eukprot:11118394-Karenia_brevis.AAC.1
MSLNYKQDFTSADMYPLSYDSCTAWLHSSGFYDQSEAFQAGIPSCPVIVDPPLHCIAGASCTMLQDTFLEKIGNIEKGVIVTCEDKDNSVAWVQEAPCFLIR